MTIKEIAKLCGVSRGTVDRVLNGRGRVKPETEARIRAAIEDLGYTKNLVGRALTVRRTAPVIAAILCSEGNPFFEDVIAGFRRAESELSDYGVTVHLLTMRGHDAQTQLRLIEEAEADASALVIQPINDPRIAARLRALSEGGVPVVTVNTDIDPLCRTCYVGSDYETGGATAAGLMRLATGGKANLGVLTGVGALMGHALRLRGFEARLKATAPDIHFIATESAEDDPAHAYDATCAMLRAHPEIDALFVVAAGAFDVCRALIDLHRDRDVRVIAFDDVPETRAMMQRGVIRAVVCQQPFEQGMRAVRAAFDIILTGELPAEGRIITENQLKIPENL